MTTSSLSFFQKAIESVTAQIDLRDPNNLTDLGFVAGLSSSLSFYEPEDRFWVLQEQLPVCFSISSEEATRIASMIEAEMIKMQYATRNVTERY